MQGGKERSVSQSMYLCGIHLKLCTVTEPLFDHYYWSNLCNLGNFRLPPLYFQTEPNDIIKVPSSGNGQSGDHDSRLLRRVGGGGGGALSEEEIGTMAEAALLLDKARNT